jgi:hypothetical protein
MAHRRPSARVLQCSRSRLPTTETDVARLSVPVRCCVDHWLITAHPPCRTPTRTPSSRTCMSALTRTCHTHTHTPHTHAHTHTPLLCRAHAHPHPRARSPTCPCPRSCQHTTCMPALTPARLAHAHTYIKTGVTNGCSICFRLLFVVVAPGCNKWQLRIAQFVLLLTGQGCSTAFGECLPTPQSAGPSPTICTRLLWTYHRRFCHSQA